MEMKSHRELVPNMDVLRAKTRNGSMKIFVRWDKSSFPIQ